MRKLHGRFGFHYQQVPNSYQLKPPNLCKPQAEHKKKQAKSLFGLLICCVPLLPPLQPATMTDPVVMYPQKKDQMLI